jgi:hypothetical protein
MLTYQLLTGRFPFWEDVRQESLTDVWKAILTQVRITTRPSFLPKEMGILNKSLKSSGRMVVMVPRLCLLTERHSALGNTYWYESLLVIGLFSE